ncbi:MAG: arginase family protein [Microbacteriaceae bacterium]|nr:MAG: arginase family protein [Microbacteriaceae bacterium]
MRLIDGANAIVGDLPSAATTVVEVPTEAGESLGTNVHRYSALLSIRAKVEAELRKLDDTVILIGGDCAAGAAGVHRAVSSVDPGSVALLWLDAHGDLNTPESSPTGAFSGMALRALLGDGPDGLASPAATRLRPGQVVLAGARSLDDAEIAYIDETGIRVIGVDELTSTDAIIEALQATGATSVYVHVDLDVLDPAAIAGVGYPEPFGLAPEVLADTIRAVRGRFALSGGCVAGFAPSSPDAASSDLSVILRTLAALTAPLS